MVYFYTGVSVASSLKYSVDDLALNLDIITEHKTEIAT